MSDVAALGLLALVVVVAAVAGLVVGRMIATRIDGWQERARRADPEHPTEPATEPATEEPGDDTDSS